MSVYQDHSVVRPSALSGFFANLAGKLAQYRAYQTTMTELNAMSDRELVDLDISRDQIRSIAYKAVYGG